MTYHIDMNRRAFTAAVLGSLLQPVLNVPTANATGNSPTHDRRHRHSHPMTPAAPRRSPDAPITVLLTGDVMTGRGIDQALPHAGGPQLYEPYVRDARDYIRLAEQLNGRLKLPLEPTYIWGDALREIERLAPDRRIANLETSITSSDRFWRGKGIHYRMHPRNIAVITAAGIDCCVLANNHVLDWGYDGLEETLATLKDVGIISAGAGTDLRTAAAPAVMTVTGRGRVVVYAFGSPSSGIPDAWAARDDRAGVNLLHELSDAVAERVAAELLQSRHPGDIVIASIHWGGNWGYRVPIEQRAFARRLIDLGAVDIVHGHSSHHPKGIELYKGKLILYGCGDLLNDYEGISGHGNYRSELRLMYFVTVDAVSGELLRLELTPFEMQRFRLQRAGSAHVEWLAIMFNREGERFGSRVEVSAVNTLLLRET
ncbi:MAG: CapA family protein [Gammaproteobacteria bacterium]|nr:CapA family protein [Gammaproteobacteria bacterium]